MVFIIKQIKNQTYKQKDREGIIELRDSIEGPDSHGIRVPEGGEKLQHLKK